MRALRLVRMAIVMCALGGAALVLAAWLGRIAVPVGVVGAGLLFLFVIPALQFVRMTIGLRAVNEKRTSGIAGDQDAPDVQKVGSTPS